MDERFNPYREWLQIDSAARPDHYALLGLAAYETDAQRIAMAADRQIALLRKTATKERLALAKQVAKEIVDARNCLLSSGDRAAYDASLRGPAPDGPRLFLPPKAFDDDEEAVEDAVETDDNDAPLEGIAIPADAEGIGSGATMLAPPPVAAAVALPPPVATNMAVRAPVALAPKRRVSPLLLAVGGGSIGLVGVLAAVLAPKWLAETPVVAANPNTPPPVVHTDFGYRPPEPGENAAAPPSEESNAAPAATETTPAMPEETPPMLAEETMPAPAENEPATTETPPEPMTPRTAAPAMNTADVGLTAEEAAANLKATEESLATVRKALSEGDLDKAIEQLNLADLEAIDVVAAEEVAATQAVVEYLRGFWRAVDEGFLGLAAGQEFEFDGRTVVVVERTPERLVIRSAGRNRGYERKRLPPPLALFLATRWLKPDDANTPLFLAAFHVFDGDGDRAEARKLLEAARSTGTAGAEELLAELDAAAPDGS
jgi:hypothetical protein